MEVNVSIVVIPLQMWRRGGREVTRDQNVLEVKRKEKFALKKREQSVAVVRWRPARRGCAESTEFAVEFQRGAQRLELQKSSSDDAGGEHQPDKFKGVFA